MHTLPKLQQLSNQNDFDTWTAFWKHTQLAHQRIHSDESRLLNMAALKTCAQLFIEDLYSDQRSVQICFRYIRLFRDPAELFGYYESHQLGFSTPEYQCQMALFVTSRQRDREKALHQLQNKTDKRSEEVRNQIQRMAEMFFESMSLDDQQRAFPKQVLEIPFDDLRDEFDKRYALWRQQLKFKLVNPFGEMVDNQLVVSKMVSFLSRKQLEIYYQHSDKHVSWVAPSMVPPSEPLVISCVEFIADIPQQIQVNDRLRFHTDFSENTLVVKKQLGSGGFAHVYKAELTHNRKVLLVSLKLFNREKDQIQFDKQAVSASYLRELYANAVLLQRVHETRQVDLLDSVDVRFNKLLCGLVGRHGNGAILLQYTAGETIFSMIKAEYHFSKVQVKSIFSQMVEIVRLIHQCCIVHCDIKVDNWILAGESVKLIDFGKAVDLLLFAEEENQLGFVGNSLHAVSPCPSCRVQWCFEADYCGLAASLFGLLCGNVLDDDDLKLDNGVASLLPKHVTGPYKKLLEELLNFQLQGDFAEQKRQDQLFLQAVKEEVDQIQ